MSASASGFDFKESEVRVVKGVKSTVRIVLSEKAVVASDDPKPLVGEQSIASKPKESQSSILTNPSVTAKNNSRTSKMPAIAALSLGAASLTGGIVYYISASNASDEAEGLFVRDPKRDDLEDRFTTRRIVSYSLLGVGAIATILGTYWILGSESDGAAQSAFRAEFSQGGAQFSGHWQF